MKEIEIEKTKYKIDYNALSYINYRKIFKTDVFKDIQIIDDFVSKQVLIANKIKETIPNITESELIKMLSRSMLSDIGLYIEAVTRLTYIGIYTVDSNIGDYESWLKKIGRINSNDKWIVEVTELAVDCFC